MLKSIDKNDNYNEIISKSNSNIYESSENENSKISETDELEIMDSVIIKSNSNKHSNKKDIKKIYIINYKNNKKILLNEISFEIKIIQENNENNIIYRRYSDFIELEKKITEEKFYCILPSLPKKDFLLKIYIEEPKMRLRIFELNLFLKYIIDNEDLKYSESFNFFLKTRSITNNQSSLNFNSLVNIYNNIKNTAFNFENIGIENNIEIITLEKDIKKVYKLLTKIITKIGENQDSIHKCNEIILTYINETFISNNKNKVNLNKLKSQKYMLNILLNNIKRFCGSIKEYNKLALTNNIKNDNLMKIEELGRQIKKMNTKLIPKIKQNYTTIQENIINYLNTVKIVNMYNLELNK